MRKIIAVMLLVLGSLTCAYAYTNYGYGSNSYSTDVSGYTRRDGTYVDSYHRTLPNRSDYDNYGTSGNYNPYNGNYGTRSPRRW
jgi:hypothetical protein